MKKIVFRDYAEVNEKILQGYAVAAVTMGDEPAASLRIELERSIGHVILGVDIMYNPNHADDETELMISEEYVKE